MRQNKLAVGKFRIIFYWGIVILGMGALFVWQKNQLENQADLQNKTSAEISDYIIAKMIYCHRNDGSNKCYKTNAEDFINRFELREIMAVFDQNEKSSEFFGSK